MTNPKIGDFINLYVKGSAPLPITEYFNKIGVSFGVGPLPNPTPAQRALFEKWNINF